MKAEIPVNAEMPTVAATAVTLPRTRRTPMRAASFFKSLTHCVLAGAMAYGSYFLITHFVLQSVQVVGNSMAPTLANTERYLLNRWVYLVREPQRGRGLPCAQPATGTRREVARGSRSRSASARRGRLRRRSCL